MHPPDRFDVKGIAKFILVQTAAVLLLVAPTTWFAARFFYDFAGLSQGADPHKVVAFVTVLACAETVAFCPIMVIPISAMMRRLQDAHARLEKLADTDALTSLLNRRGLEKAAERLIARAAWRGDAVAALVCDLDHFKLINDTYGHEAGDEALRAVGRLLEARFSDEGAVAGRLGGEEFLILVAVANPRAAEAAGEELRRAFEACEIDASGVFVRCTLSVGVAAAPAPCDLGRLIARADAALYAAKSGGRNRVVFGEAALRAA